MVSWLSLLGSVFVVKKAQQVPTLSSGMNEAGRSTSQMPSISQASCFSSHLIFSAEFGATPDPNDRFNYRALFDSEGRSKKELK